MPSNQLVPPPGSAYEVHIRITQSFAAIDAGSGRVGSNLCKSFVLGLPGVPHHSAWNVRRPRYPMQVKLARRVGFGNREPGDVWLPAPAKLIEEPAGIILDRETFVLDPGIHWPREGPRPEMCPEVRGYPGNPD